MQRKALYTDYYTATTVVPSGLVVDRRPSASASLLPVMLLLLPHIPLYVGSAVALLLLRGGNDVVMMLGIRSSSRWCAGPALLEELECIPLRLYSSRMRQADPLHPAV